jgi:hypothetical protein
MQGASEEIQEASRVMKRASKWMQVSMKAME